MQIFAGRKYNRLTETSNQLINSVKVDKADKIKDCSKCIRINRFTRTRNLFHSNSLTRKRHKERKDRSKIDPTFPVLD